MKYILGIVCLILIFATSVMADSDVTELQLSWKNGEMVLKIDAAGSFQYSHQIEEAKDGKNFRIIADLFPAIHKLSERSFLDLPPSIVKSVRTSQYSVEPTKTVRIVLDLKHESVYRIEKVENSLYIYIPDKEISSFPIWSSNDRQNDASPPIPAKPKVKPDVKVVESSEPIEEVAVTESWEPESTYYQPRQSDLIDLEKTKPAEQSSLALGDLPEPRTNKDTEKPEKPKTESKKKEEPVKPVEKDSVNKDQSIKKKKVYAENVKPVKKAPVTTPKSQTKVAVTTATAGSSSSTIADEAVRTEPAKEKVTKKPTSRFRREAAIPAKLKGTIVAEFPKRMVIKYAPANSRDPFKSLIDETKKTENPLFKKLPDVETAKLVGILESDNGQNRALLEDLDGYGFILKPGDKVKKGYVSQIYSNKALFQLFEYGWSRSVALHLEDGE